MFGSVVVGRPLRPVSAPRLAHDMANGGHGYIGGQGAAIIERSDRVADFFERPMRCTVYRRCWRGRYTRCTSCRVHVHWAFLRTLRTVPGDDASLAGGLGWRAACMQGIQPCRKPSRLPCWTCRSGCSCRRSWRDARLLAWRGRVCTIARSSGSWLFHRCYRTSLVRRAASILAFARSVYSSDSSKPTNSNPSSTAALPVLPDPANGSRTVPRGGVIRRHRYRIRSVGLTVG